LRSVTPNQQSPAPSPQTQTLTPTAPTQTPTPASPGPQSQTPALASPTPQTQTPASTAQSTTQSPPTSGMQTQPVVPAQPVFGGYMMMAVPVIGYYYAQPAASQGATAQAVTSPGTPAMPSVVSPGTMMQPMTSPGSAATVSPGMAMQPMAAPGMAPMVPSGMLMQPITTAGLAMQPWASPWTTVQPGTAPAQPAITTQQAGFSTTATAALQMPFQITAGVTQGFGPTSYAAEPPYDGYAHFHTGIDFGVPSGTAITAAASGRVVAAGWDDSGFGIRVLIDHGNGTRTLYGHLQSALVAPGDTVQAGQEIGLSGSTGNSSGPHLHFGVENNGRWVDPAPYLQGPAGTVSTGASAPLTPANPAVAPTPANADGTAALSSTLAPIRGGQTDTTTNPAPATAQSATSPAVLNFSNLIRQVSLATGVSSSLLSSVVHAESSGDPHAVSPDNARGLMQLTDTVAQTYGVKDVFDPQQNLMGGALYLRNLLQRYSGNETLALAAYNAGPGAVDQYGGVPPYSETRDYVQRVLALQRQYASAP